MEVFHNIYELDIYQRAAVAFDVGGISQPGPVVHIVGLAEEAGEVMGKFKKAWRDGVEIDRMALIKELGGVMWYVAAIAADHNIELSEIANVNIAQLQDRQNRGVIRGAGDDR